MAKIHILLYRQWDIYFSTENERFIVENDVNEMQKEKPSFASATAFVDAFIKENLVFEPFQVERLTYRGEVDKTATVIGIRKDGRFVLEDRLGEKSQVSEWDEKDWFLVQAENQPIRAEMQAIDAEMDKVLRPLRARISALKDKLKCISLADQKRAEKYADWVDKKKPNRFGQD